MPYAARDDQPFRVREPYAPRPVRSGQIVSWSGWRLKPYDITLPGEPLEEAAFDLALPEALRALPLPAASAARPGVGFLIRHQGRGWSYLVLCWWDRENELPIRIWTRERVDGSAWAPARPDQSICVWDAQVVAFERDAFVRLVLSRPDQPQVEAYLAERFGSR